MRTRAQLSKGDREIRMWLTIVAIGLVILVILMWYVKAYMKLEKEERRVNSQWGVVKTTYVTRIGFFLDIAYISRGYYAQEKEAFEKVYTTRSKTFDVDIDPMRLSDSIFAVYDAAQAEFANSLSDLLIVLEKYPELKENKTYNQRLYALKIIDGKIAYERRNFNEAALKFNTNLHTFPKNIAASIRGIKERPYLVLYDEPKVAPTN